MKEVDARSKIKTESTLPYGGYSEKKIEASKNREPQAARHHHRRSGRSRPVQLTQEDVSC
jgi:hypothetical protein